MSLSVLPAVLLQSLMQCLDAKEILRFARSCRYTVLCASSPFAWSCCPPLWLPLGMELRSPSVRCTFSRYLPLHVQFFLDRSDEAAVAAMIRLAEANRVVRLHTFQFFSGSHDGFFRVITSPALVASLTDVNLGWAEANVINSALHLPKLQTLRCAFESFANLDPSLIPHSTVTALCIDDTRWNPRPGSFPLCGAFPLLRTFEIRSPRIGDDNWLIFCKAMSGVRELIVLHWAGFTSVSTEQLAAGVAMMRGLQRLEWKCRAEITRQHLGGRGSLMETLVYALPPSLRSLALYSRSAPEEALVWMMQARPSLVVSLRAAGPLQPRSFKRLQLRFGSARVKANTDWSWR